MWAAVGLSVALMAPSMAANINPQASGTIGTLILLVAYVLATLGCAMLVFVRRKLPVPMWQIVVPIAALIVLGYTLYRNVIPYPTGAGAWFPVVWGAWLAVAVLAVVFAPRTARKLGAALAAREGIAAPGAEDRVRGAHRRGLAAVKDEAS